MWGDMGRYGEITHLPFEDEDGGGKVRLEVVAHQALPHLGRRLRLRAISVDGRS